MILNASQGQIETFGDVKNYQTSIDPKNLDFITTLLSSNLYSNPESSFIREIVSNAWDSHVEAGNTDIPVIIDFDNEHNNISIRDFGTGLSKERFENIYCKIGSSTKRDSDDYIGAFGIGRFSALACSNTVYITSYYEGIMYQYVMSKIENNITITLIDERETSEKNGLEVSLKNLPSLTDYLDALKAIAFFPNVYINGTGSDINNSKKKRYKHFSASEIEADDYKILLGNVLYPINASKLAPDVYAIYVNLIKNTNLVLNFNIGELPVTPNRESILYSNSAIKKIEDKLRLANDEFNNEIAKLSVPNYNDMLEYRAAINNKVSVADLINNKIAYIHKYSYDYRPHVNISPTYKGRTIEDGDNYLIKIISTQTIIYNKAEINFGSFKKRNTQKELSEILYMKCVYAGNQRMTSYVKEYLEQNYNEYIVIEKIDKLEFYEHVMELHKTYSTSPSFNCMSFSLGIDYIIDELWESLINKIEFIDFTDKEFTDFKAKCIEENKKNKGEKKVKNIILHKMYTCSDSYTRFIIRDKDELKSWFRNPVYITDFDSRNDSYAKAARELGYNVIALSGQNKEIVLNIGFKTIITKNELIKNRQAIRAYTISKFIKDNDGSFLNKIDYIFQYLNNEDYAKVSYLNSIIRNLHNWTHIVYSFHKYNFFEVDPILYNLLCEIRDKVEKIYAKIDEYRDDIVDPNKIGSIILVKTKTYRPNYYTYQQQTESKFYKLLCSK